MQEKEWKTIKLSKIGPPISHLFFADDLFLFGEASMHQLEVTMQCLNLFCEASGGRVSKEKTRLFVSRNVHHARARELSSYSGFQMTGDLSKYLGVPILHQRQTNSTYVYIVENAQKRLASWKVGCLAMAGRITLTQTVLAALPTYTMQTALLPKGVCRKLEKMSRDFIWGSKSDAKSWHSIAWNKFCKPKEEGGVGLRDLYSFNKALIMKAGWGLITTPDAFWVQVVKAKYGCGQGILPVVIKKNQASSFWRGINGVWKDLMRGVQWTIGDGKRVRFWYDRWLPSGLILNETTTVVIPDELVEQSVDFFSHESGHWKTNLIRPYLHEWAFKEVMGCRVAIPYAGEDRPCWGLSPVGEFTTKSAYRLLTGRRERGSKDWQVVWKWPGPQRVKCFIWMVLSGGLKTNSLRRRCGTAESDVCPICVSGA